MTKLNTSLVNDGTNYPWLFAPDIIACDHCGIVAMNTPRFGWKRWTEHIEKPREFYGLVGATTDPEVKLEPAPPVIVDVVRHHCPAAVELNEAIRNFAVHMVAPETAVDYEDWIEE